MLRSLLLVLTLALACTEAGAINILQCPWCALEAPDGMTYDKALSVKTGLEVFRSRDNKLIFALGAEKVQPGMTARSVAEAFSGACGITSVMKVGSSGPGEVLMVHNPESRQTIGVVDTAGGKWLPVAIIVGDISAAQASRYLATLRPKVY